jgi:hypothetical protein
LPALTLPFSEDPVPVNVVLLSPKCFPPNPADIGLTFPGSIVACFHKEKEPDEFVTN